MSGSVAPPIRNFSSSGRFSNRRQSTRFQALQSTSSTSGLIVDKHLDRTRKLNNFRRIFYNATKENFWFECLSSLCDKHFTCLEIGAGSGIGDQNTLYPTVERIVGVDLDERVVINPNLDEAYVCSAYELDKCLSDQKFDLIYSHMVAEHIEDGHKFISNQLAFLKSDGVIFHSTVSKFYWTSMLNDFVPESIKFQLIKHLGSGRTEEDIFPTHYKLNSNKQVELVCRNLKVDYKIFRQDEPPGYLRRSYVLMFLYTIIHKPLQFILPELRPIFIFVIRKKEL